jgi:MinD-like ATPase involved in chromosome partitioning or flagellar assembly
MASRREGSAGLQREPSLHQLADGVFPPSRLAAGLGDPEREQLLLSALGSTGDIVVAERCLSADQLVACVQRGSADAVLVAYDLHRLNESRLDELAQSRLPLVLLVPDPDDERWQSFPGALLPLDAQVGTVRQALLAVIRGEHPRPATQRAAAEVPRSEPAGTAHASEALSVIALASGHGSPGRTTVAVSLAAALGAVASTVLVDADLSGPSIAAWLDADPTRNISMLVHAEPETPRDWDRAIAQEAQPLHPRSPYGVVLCGVPKPEMRSLIPIRFFERLVAELRRRYRYVILDTGADFLGADVALHRTALALAQQILLVGSADLVGLWHTRTALGLLQNQLALGPERIALLINRYDRRYHHGRAEIEWALGLPAAAIIPYDHGSVQRALAAQHPLILEGRSRARRALVDLAERVHGGSILLPPEIKEEKRGGRLHLPRSHGRVRAQRARSRDQGVRDGDYVTPLT